jgi:hypothetical protein
MNARLVILMLLTVLVASIAASTAEVSTDQLKQLMAKSAENLSSYTYSRSADSFALYNNSSLEKKLEVFKTTEGKVDLQEMSAWWASKLTTKEDSGVLNWQSYFVNGSSYLNVGDNWTRLDFNDPSRIKYDFDELAGEIALIQNSDMKLSGSENISGNDYFKLVGKPNETISRALIARQILSALSTTPIQLPENLTNQKINIDESDLINKSKLIITAWVSKDDSLLKRLDVNSSLTITPQILNISSPDFKIETSVNESTIYSDFGLQVEIELPKEAQNESSLLRGAAWSRAVMGSIISANGMP